MRYIRLLELNMRGLPRVETCTKIEDNEVELLFLKFQPRLLQRKERG
jgi:hypothetical protein